MSARLPHGILELVIASFVTWAGAEAPAQAPLSPEVLVEFNTSLGRIVIAVDKARAPLTSANFLQYVDTGLYDGGRFHRATRSRPGEQAGRMPAVDSVQAGMRAGREAERFRPVLLERTSVTGLRHLAGAVSMARPARADSATSEFFILLADSPALDEGGDGFADRQGAAPFGRVVSGLDVVRRIQLQPSADGALMPPVSILRASRVR